MTHYTISCSSCGGPLEAPAGARYLTCGFCGARLEVHQEGNAIYATLLEEVAARTAAIEDGLETIQLQNELERLDREWMMQRDTLLVRDKEGNTSRPSAAGSVIGAVVAVAFGIGWMVFAAQIGAPPCFVLFGLVFVGIAIFTGVSGANKAGRYDVALREYERRRGELIRQLEAETAKKTSTNID